RDAPSAIAKLAKLGRESWRRTLASARASRRSPPSSMIRRSRIASALAFTRVQIWLSPPNRLLPFSGGSTPGEARRTRLVPAPLEQCDCIVRQLYDLGAGL